MNVLLSDPVQPILAQLPCNFDLIGQGLVVRVFGSITVISMFIDHASILAVLSNVVITLKR